MATLVANVGQAGTSGAGTTTSAIDTTGVTFIIVTVAGNAAVTITDSKGNTWERIVVDGTTPVLNVFTTIPTSVGSGHTFSTGAFTLCAVTVQAWSGTSGWPIQRVTNAASGTIVNGSITATGDCNDNLFITGVGVDGTPTMSIDGSFTISDGVVGVVGQSFGCDMAYKVSSGSESPTWTRSSGTGNNRTFMICVGVLGSSGGGEHSSVY